MAKRISKKSSSAGKAGKPAKAKPRKSDAAKADAKRVEAVEANLGQTLSLREFKNTYLAGW